MTQRSSRVSLAAALTLAAAAAAGCSGGSSPSPGPSVATTAPVASLTTTPTPSSPAPAGSGPTALRATVSRTLTVPPVFTQGFEILDDGRAVQSYGLYGKSGTRLIDLSTGEVTKASPGAADQFGEGIARRSDGHLLQLTWREGVVNVLDPQTLSVTSTLPIDTQGWGICIDDSGQAWTSDGSSTLTARDPGTMTAGGSIEVRLDGAPVRALNELECTPDGIWANVWQQDRLLRISPEDGRVTATLDLTDLAARAPRSDTQPRSEEVLNGIAWDGASGLLWVTGKEWTEIYGLSLSQ